MTIEQLGSRAMHRRFLTGAILALGLSVAVAIYLTAAPAPQNDDLDEMVQSKQYERQVEMLGGKAAVLATDLTRWFSGLWQGKPLAYTVACLTVLAALVSQLARGGRRDGR